MRTPVEWNKKLKQNIITEDMLEFALYSVNKRAKNWRDKKREYRRVFSYYDNAGKAEENEQKMYRLKGKLLNFIKPICVHQEFFGFEKTRIYDYEDDFSNKFIKSALNDEIVWVNHYIDRDNDDYWDGYNYYDDGEEVWFFDKIDTTKPKSHWYLYYIVGGHTFHTPIDEDDVPLFVKDGLKIEKIPTLNTTGEDILELASMPFVNKVISLIESGNAIYEPNVEKKSLPKYQTGWRNQCADTITYNIPEMISFAFGEKASELVRKKIKGIININKFKECCALDASQKEALKNRILKRYGQGCDIDINYILKASFLSKNAPTEINYEEVESDLRSFNNFTLENVTDCLAQHTNIEKVEEFYFHQQGMKNYIRLNWEDIKKEALSNIPLQYEKQRQKSIKRIEKQRQRAEEKSRKKSSAKS